MVTSIYLKQYFDWLTNFLDGKLVPISTPSRVGSKTSQSKVFYNPSGDVSSMIETISRPDILDKNTSEWTFMGYSRSPIQKSPDAKLRNTGRVRDSAQNPGSSSDRHFSICSINVNVTILANSAMAIENFEEVYNTWLLDGRSVSIPIQLHEVFEFDSTDFAINTIHGDITESGVARDKTNLFYTGFEVNLVAPVFELSASERTKLSAITVNLFEQIENPDRLIKTYVRRY